MHTWVYIYLSIYVLLFCIMHNENSIVNHRFQHYPEYNHHHHDYHHHSIINITTQSSIIIILVTVTLYHPFPEYDVYLKVTPES